jgi:hypothetical protein
MRSDYIPGKYEQRGADIGALVDRKNAAYGDSFHKQELILKIFFPLGIRPDQYKLCSYIQHILDKIFRMINQPKAFGENPAKDATGYSLLMSDDYEGERKEERADR